MPAGRPSEYTDAKAEAICDRIAEGEYLTDICELKDFPSYKTVRKWIKEHDDFSKSIARAGDDQADYYRWRISKLNDSMTAANWQFVNAQIHNIQWLMAKLKAKYGDKTAITGADGGAIQIVSTIPRPPVV